MKVVLSKVNKDDKFFVDTNILIFLFSPDFVESKEHQVDKYSKIYGKLLAKKCSLYINSIVMSEFINRCLRLDFNKNFQNKEKTKDFKKDYRGSDKYKDTLPMILKELGKFMKNNVHQIDDNFSDFNINKEYENNNNNNLDFNDLIIAKNTIDNGFSLLTNDRDFNSLKNINILQIR